MSAHTSCLFYLPIMCINTKSWWLLHIFKLAELDIQIITLATLGHFVLFTGTFKDKIVIDQALSRVQHTLYEGKEEVKKSDKISGTVA